MQYRIYQHALHGYSLAYHWHPPLPIACVSVCPGPTLCPGCTCTFIHAHLLFTCQVELGGVVDLSDMANARVLGHVDLVTTDVQYTSGASQVRYSDVRCGTVQGGVTNFQSRACFHVHLEGVAWCQHIHTRSM